MTTPEPLWRAMDLAYDRSVAPDGEPMWESYHGYAAELRAIADWLVPEEPRPKTDDALSPGDWGAKITRWLANQEKRNLLLAEADRAEAGE